MLQWKKCEEYKQNKCAKYTVHMQDLKFS